jgi:hypothetical protein
MSEYAESIINWFNRNGWIEPTEDKYATYVMANKMAVNKSNSPYFEDMHYIYRNYKPN